MLPHIKLAAILAPTWTFVASDSCQMQVSLLLLSSRFCKFHRNKFFCLCRTVQSTYPAGRSTERLFKGSSLSTTVALTQQRSCKDKRIIEVLKSGEADFREEVRLIECRSPLVGYLLSKQ